MSPEAFSSYRRIEEKKGNGSGVCDKLSISQKSDRDTALENANSVRHWLFLLRTDERLSFPDDKVKAQCFNGGHLMWNEWAKEGTK